MRREGRVLVGFCEKMGMWLLHHLKKETRLFGRELSVFEERIERIRIGVRWWVNGVREWSSTVPVLRMEVIVLIISSGLDNRGFSIF